jgi:DNA polymerase (family 10)
MTRPTSAEAISLLAEIKTLMELGGENPFKIRAFEKAATLLADRDDLLVRAEAGTLTELEGVGKGIADVLTEFLLKGKSTARDELSAQLPPGLLELIQIPGLGPKKARQIIDELSIHSLRELEYACRENRLLKLKGFGQKMQQKILEGIHFLNRNAGLQRLGDVFEASQLVLEDLKKSVGEGTLLSESGALRRRCEVLDRLEFLVESDGAEAAQAQAKKSRTARGLPIEVAVFEAKRSVFGYELARRTATPAHWAALGSPVPSEGAGEDEVRWYESQGLPWIAPEMRETGEEVVLAQKQALGEVLGWNDVRGVFHNHTHASDGTASLEEMVLAAKELGFEYLGISDHSQSAFYAQGLKYEQIEAQEKEVRRVQEKYPEVRIFWGIESDILADGALDYDAKVLRKFDFVVASIHSRFKMEREAMTDRILEAVRNPYTTFLGHPTGRLLLGRPGYDFDFEKVIEECARLGVPLELNSNPARLDIDWRWGPHLRQSGANIVINPDAHEVAGLKDTVYGIAMARKALLPRSLVVNTRSTKEMEHWISLRRKH